MFVLRLGVFGTLIPTHHQLLYASPRCSQPLKFEPSNASRHVGRFPERLVNGVSPGHEVCRCMSFGFVRYHHTYIAHNWTRVSGASWNQHLRPAERSRRTVQFIALAE